MNLEDQVCSFEVAKKLRDLGVKQESVFYYVETYTYRLRYGKYNWGSNISAFTFTDILKQLPDEIHKNDMRYMLKIDKYNCIYENTLELFLRTHREVKQSLTEHLAEMLVLLLEKELITI